MKSEVWHNDCVGSDQTPDDDPEAREAGSAVRSERSERSERRTRHLPTTEKTMKGLRWVDASFESVTVEGKGGRELVWCDVVLRQNASVEHRSFVARRKGARGGDDGPSAKGQQKDPATK